MTGENATNLRYRRERKRGSSSVEALTKAQEIAFAPFTFQATGVLLELGILKYIDETPASIVDIVRDCRVSEYTVSTLFDVAECAGIVACEDGKYTATKVGQAFLYDEMTRVNFNFVKDVCYLGASELLNSFQTAEPCGLHKFLGNYPTIYPALTKLPPQMQKSWYEFDHYYSDGCFEEVLKIIFKDNPEEIFDIGGNTGKFEKACLAYDEKCKVTMLDLPENIDRAKQNINSSRCNFCGINVVDKSYTYPKFCGAVFMSQFLDCFSKEQILYILSNICENMADDTKIYILEPFIDNQIFRGAAYSLTHISLYFTCMANGKSKMYKKSDMEKLIEDSGLKVSSEYRISSHDYTLLECVKA